MQTHQGSAGELGETGLISAIRDWLSDASPPSPHGIGDDCALFSITPGSESLVTTDPVLWGRHFDETVTPENVAGKLFKRNLSDIAAMGGRPRIAVVSLLLPGRTSLEWLERFYRGLRDVSRQYKVPLAGGDVSETDSLLAACMTVIGETTGGRALTRTGGNVGDHLWITGSLGGSRQRHHFAFEPRLEEGQWLTARPDVTACMDVSDGLAKDLPSLIPEGCEAELIPESIPVSRDATTTAATTGDSPLRHALCDGEDHELLFLMKPNGDPERFEREWNDRFTTPVTRIGVLRARPENSKTPRLRGLPPEMDDTLHGYEHLR